MRYPLFALALLAMTMAGPTASLAAPPHPEFKPKVRYAQVGDVKLAYYTRGKGTPLLMINGFSSGMSLWDPALLERLAKHHQLILFDPRGVGLSTDTEENRTTIPQMADDAAGLIRSLGFAKAHILGWSMGARVAQQVLIRHPDLVAKGVLCAPNPGGSHQDPASQDVEGTLNGPNVPNSVKIGLAFPDDDRGRLAEKQVMARIRAAVAAGTMPDDFQVSKETAERQVRARTTLWKDSNANYDALKSIRNPVLVTDGRDDVLDPPGNSVIVATQIPFSWLAFFDGGHAFLFQEYARFASTVNLFLE